jgi:hypothetical protein
MLLSALLLVGLPGAAMSQDEATEPEPVWRSATKQGAADVAALGEGYVLVGGKSKPVQTKVWTSPDGQIWTRVTDPALEGAAITRVSAHEGGVVALGSRGRRLVGWSSPDGQAWQKTTIDRAPKELTLFPVAVTDGPAGLIAAAHLIGQDLAGQGLYLSSDGASWTEIDPPLEASDGMIVSLASDGDEYLAIASATFGQDADLYWRSSDGQTWQPFEGPAGGALLDIAIGADGSYAAVGHVGEGPDYRSAIWRADQLGQWEQVYTSPSAKQTEERLDVIAVGADGFVASGSTSGCPQQDGRFCPEAAILESADGREWVQLGVADGVPGPLHDTTVNQVATNGSSTVMLAWHERRPTETWTQPATSE